MDSEVERLKEKLAAEIRSNQKAAEYGLQLLEQIKSLQVTNQKQKTEYEISVESFRQQIHTLTGKLDATQQILKDQAGELELSKEMYETIQRKVNSIEVEHQRQLSCIEVEKSQLEMESLEKDNMISTLKNDIIELQHQIHNISRQGNFSDTTDSFEQSLQMENQELLVKNRELEDRLLELEKDLLTAKENAEEVKAASQQIQEELICRDNKLSDCMLQKYEIQEEMDLLRSELETLKLGQLDVKKRGNSLFAEVEDNRKALENEVKSLRKRVKLLNEKDEANEQTIKQMSHQISYLINMSNQRVDSNYVLKLSQDLSQARGEIEELKLRAERSPTGVASSVDCAPKYKCKDYAFMNTLIDEKESRIASLLSELKSVNLMKTSLNNRIVQTDKHLYMAEKKNDTLKAENSKLKQSLEELKKKSGFTIQRTEIKVEKIPGIVEKENISESNDKSDQELGQTALKLTQKIKSQLSESKENMHISDLSSKKKPLNKDITSKGTVKESTRTVSFAEPDTKEIGGEKLSEKNSKMVCRKAGVPGIFVSSEDASTPSNCAQQ